MAKDLFAAWDDGGEDSSTRGLLRHIRGFVLRENMKKAFIFIFTGLGLVLTFLLIIGATNDFASFDRTKGGYEPPYEGYTGRTY